MISFISHTRLLLKYETIRVLWPDNVRGVLVVPLISTQNLVVATIVRRHRRPQRHRTFFKSFVLTNVF